MIRKKASVLLSLVCLIVVPTSAVRAADDESVARAREMLRRTQDALHQLQSENAELSRSKTELDVKLKDATRQLDAARSGLNATQSSLKSVQGQQSDLQTKYTDASTRLASTTDKLNQTTISLTTRDAELAKTLQQLNQSKAANASCEDKNGKLYAYGQEILARYQHKGVWAALKQKEPVLGLNRVEVENVVQEYKLKMAEEKLKPAAH